MFELIDVLAVEATMEEGVYIVTVRFTMNGELIEGPYGYRPTDPADLAQQIGQWLADHEGEYVIIPYVPPAPMPYSLAIELLWSRMLDEEAEEFDEAISTASPLRLRKQFNAASSMMSDGELFGFVRTVMLGVFEEVRVDVILAEPFNGSMSEIAAAV
jgi:hypothetical protein